MREQQQGPSRRVARQAAHHGFPQSGRQCPVACEFADHRHRGGVVGHHVDRAARARQPLADRCLHRRLAAFLRSDQHAQEVDRLGLLGRLFDNGHGHFDLSVAVAGLCSMYVHELYTLGMLQGLL